MIIYTEFIIKKEEKKRNAAVKYCGVSYLGLFREDERERKEQSYSRPCSRMMTIRTGSTHWT